MLIHCIYKIANRETTITAIDTTQTLLAPDVDCGDDVVVAFVVVADDVVVPFAVVVVPATVAEDDVVPATVAVVAVVAVETVAVVAVAVVAVATVAVVAVVAVETVTTVAEVAEVEVVTVDVGGMIGTGLPVNAYKVYAELAPTVPPLYVDTIAV